MKQKPVFYAELAYVLGILAMSLGTALMERADFGMSMIVAPAYLLHLKISQTLPFYTFGMSEYILQLTLIIVISLVMRKFKKGYLFCFATAVIYGLTLDACISLLALAPFAGIVWRAFCYFAGMLVCAIGVSCLFHTYLPPEAYELFVKELSGNLGTEIHRTKTAYDIVSCVVSVLLSFAFFGFGHFEGVKLGTLFCALINGALIGHVSRFLERNWEFKDAFPWRPIFTA